MQAITTKYLGPTNYRGSRVKAKCQAGSITISWDDALEVNENHHAAAVALVAKLGWDKDCYASEMSWGGLPNGEGNAYTFKSNRIVVRV